MNLISSFLPTRSLLSPNADTGIVVLRKLRAIRSSTYPNPVMARWGVLLVCCLLIISSRAEPVIVANDPFTDGDFASASGLDPLGLVWFQNKQALKIVNGEEGLNDGGALHFNPTVDFGTFTTHFPAVPLVSADDTLIVAFDYMLPVGLPKAGSGLRMGVYDSRSTLRTSDVETAAGNDDVGYGLSSNAGGGGERDTQCFREGPGNAVLGGPEPAQIVGGGTRGPCLPADGNTHHLRLIVKKTSDGGLEISCNVDDLVLTTMMESPGSLLTSQFDGFALGFGGVGNIGAITIDNFNVSASTQQPLTSMLPKAPPATGPVFRQWTNLQNRQIEAALLSYDATAATAKLVMRDGREFVLPLNSLCEADGAFITKNMASSPTLSSVSSTAWAVQYPDPLQKAEAKLESGRTVLRTLRDGHPRLMMLEDDWDSLKSLVGTDPTAIKLYAAVRTAGESYLNASPLEHVLPDGVRLLDTSREFIGRIYVFGLLHRLDGDPKWSASAIKEMLNICSFTDWNPSHFLDVAEMAHGMAVGYDWFFDQLTEAERVKVRESIKEKAFVPALAVYAKPTGWHQNEHLNNWNHVCNGGLIIAALAIADEEKKMSQEIIEAAMSSLEPAMNLYLPDGAWDEGQGYWDYATCYVISCSEALRTATGSDGGISGAPALDKAAEFMQHSAGASGRSFNFADGGPSTWNRPAFMWMGRRFQRPDYGSMIKSQIQRFGADTKYNWFGSAHALIWFDREAELTEWQKAPCDRVFRRIEMVSLRSSWEPDAWSISVKGGDNRFSHGHLDLGTFVIDALGIRWGMDLGADNYGLEGYFGEKRFTHYRTSSPGQNTLTWDNQNQELDGTGHVETFESTPNKSWTVVDLSKGYQAATQVRRGAMLIRGDSPAILIQDEITKPRDGSLIWAMHTQATVETSGNTAVLSSGGRQIKATILQPENAIFDVQEINLVPPANPTSNTRKLTIKQPVSKGNLTIAVSFTATNGASSPVPVTPLDEWGGKVVPR